MSGQNKVRVALGWRGGEVFAARSFSEHGGVPPDTPNAPEVFEKLRLSVSSQKLGANIAAASDRYTFCVNRRERKFAFPT